MFDNLNVETNYFAQKTSDSLNELGNIFSNSILGNEFIPPATKLGGSGSQHVVFIDAAITEDGILSNSFENADVFKLDANFDGITQITNVLVQYESLASVHIVSHGSAGDVLLGNNHVNSVNISSYSSDLESWSQAFTQNTDVLFYGCNVGLGAEGLAFVQQVSQITGADIAASIDVTGNAALGGNWKLEVQTGTIESSIVLNNQAIAQYENILPIYNGKNYVLTNVAKTWEQAQTEAVSLGGNLVTINDAGEQTWLRQTFGSNELFWIGFTDRTIEGQFRWVNGETSTYTNWAPGEPNNFNGNEDYVAMNANTTGQWNDLPSTAMVRGIIEIGPKTYNGKEYWLTDLKTWEQAQTEAVSLGGNLVTINDAAEQTWLRQTFGSNELFWIGFTDRTTEGQFRWVNGETFKGRQSPLNQTR